MKQINFLLLINVFLFINNVCYSMDNIEYVNSMGFLNLTEEQSEREWGHAKDSQLTNEEWNELNGGIANNGSNKE